jgi:predicted ATP-dependent endonuclease of OLD family
LGASVSSDDINLIQQKIRLAWRLRHIGETKMHISHVEIGNFRKLKAVRIDFSDKTTVFVGANNSGKTSAMVALRQFLVKSAAAEFSVNDFTLTHWSEIDKAAINWEATTPSQPLAPLNWEDCVPFLDLWLSVANTELHHVHKLLPTLEWDGGKIGVRLRFEPKDRNALQQEYLKERVAATSVLSAPTSVATKSATFSLWPRSMMEFLAKRLHSAFQVKAYLLDPAALKEPESGQACPQVLPPESEPLDSDPLHGLICVDEIGAQRGFGHTTNRSASGDEEPSQGRSGKKLSTQLRSYYTQHLDPFDKPEAKDLAALQALHEAQSAFGQRLSDCFSEALKELGALGYPGLTDPKLTITANIQPIDGLKHGSAVQYEVPTHFPDASPHRLPEDSNGLGYQNLVSMVFGLMSFRDKWMKVGKAGKATGDQDHLIPPLHLVLIEEPEAHLHAQVQQVFINEAYKVLRNHPNLKDAQALRTQLVVSTHSSHLAHEVDFASLRYFRRLPASSTPCSVPIASVINLSEIFNDEDETKVFVKRYLKTTHCDLFFADGAIFIEGPAERILIPHWVREKDAYEYLRHCYITYLEIGGSHAHRLKKLVEHLGLNTLIITDIDAKDGTTQATVIPKRSAGQRTRNETLKTWIPAKESLDDLLDLLAQELVKNDSSGYGIRVAYQQPVLMSLTNGSPAAEILPNTFEDCLVYENQVLFAKLCGNGLIKKFKEALNNSVDLDALAQSAQDALKSGIKAEFALDLLYSNQINELKVPKYIHDGLIWLVEQLERKEADTVKAKVAP